MGSCVVDFASFERELIIETNGGQRNEVKFSPSPSLSLQGRGILQRVMEKTRTTENLAISLGARLVFVVAGFVPAYSPLKIRGGRGVTPAEITPISPLL
jgi:hypothetical protein